jgi:hypothetical protein
MSQILVESNQNVFESEIINEADGKGIYLTGIFAQADIVNRNKRFYPSRVLDPAVDKYVTEMVNTQRALGELEHPNHSHVNIERSTHKIVSLTKEGSNYIGKAKVLNTPLGQLIKNLVEDDVKLGVSTRGAGSLKKRSDGINEVQNDFKLFTVDIVHQPSAPDSFVSSLVESDSFIKLFSNEGFLYELEDFLKAKKQIKEANKQDRYALSITAFDNMLKSFKKI